jgi:hypothetical protein
MTETVYDLARDHRIAATFWRYTGKDPLDPTGTIPWRDLTETYRIDDTDDLFVSPVLLSGTSLYERSNRRVFIRLFGSIPGVYVSGINDSFTMIRFNVADREILDALEALTNYPLLDEQDHSELEREVREKAVEEWAADDLKWAFVYKARADDLQDDELSELVDAINAIADAGAFVDGFDSLAEMVSVEWNEDHINVQRIADETDLWVDLLDGGPNGWARGLLLSVKLDLTELFGLLPGFMSLAQTSLMLDVLWLYEGVQPELVVGPFDEASLLQRLREAQLDLREAQRIAEMVASMSPEGLEQYETLANRFVVLTTALDEIALARESDEEDLTRETFVRVAPVVAKVAVDMAGDP